MDGGGALFAAIAFSVPGETNYSISSVRVAAGMPLYVVTRSQQTQYQRGSLDSSYRYKFCGQGRWPLVSRHECAHNRGTTSGAAQRRPDSCCSVDNEPKRG
eukprot:GHVU01206461.1.p1 GENE.GHVU01206461.1~~GHVU01206461.1.p1  ORF type:complete len:101 (-),score=8.43 GHVU01206461.1:124-426(-)